MSLQGLMVHRIDIETKTVVKDSSGGKVDDWSARLLSRPCRIEPAKSSKVLDFDKLGIKVSHIIYMNQFNDITDQDRIKFIDRRGKTRYFEVRGAKDTDELGRLIEIWAQEIPT